MTGGIYYEHAHRLFGSLVGLTTLALAAHLQRADDRRAVRRFALVALGLVVVQGLLGGLRVTGRFTLGTDTAPSLALAVVHGVTGQLFFCATVALAAVTTRGWRSGAAPEVLPAASTDRGLTRLLATLLVTQLVLGAIQRHYASGLIVHISFAVLVVLAALAAGVRAWGVHERRPPLPALGRLLLALVVVQVLLGIASLLVTADRPNHPAPTTADVIVTTAHQATGAGLLATAVLLALWTTRRLRPPPRA
jgi:cytochrome c oxidase assembly protein subunit 15